MSTKALYHAFSIYGYPIKGCFYESQMLFIEVEVPDAKLKCSACGCCAVCRFQIF